jgi:hypothetical protein
MSRRFQIAITESDRRKRRGIEKTSTDSEVRKPKRKTPDVVVAQNWTGKGAAANRGTLGERQLEIKKPPGASRKISDDAIVVLKQELETGEGFSSYGAIVEWLEKEHGQCIEYGTVYGWVRYRLGAKLKVPRPQSYKQDEMSAVLLILESLLAQGKRIRYLCQDETRVGMKT